MKNVSDDNRDLFFVLDGTKANKKFLYCSRWNRILIFSCGSRTKRSIRYVQLAMSKMKMSKDNNGRTLAGLPNTPGRLASASS